MQESRQLCLLINWSWCFIYLLRLIPHWLISCGQSLNAFRGHAFVMSSASGSVPLVLCFPSKGGRFLSPSSRLTGSALHSCNKAWASVSAQDRSPWALEPLGLPIETPKEKAISTTKMGVLGKKLPCGTARAICMVDRSQVLESLGPGTKSQF